MRAGSCRLAASVAVPVHGDVERTRAIAGDTASVPYEVCKTPALGGARVIALPAAFLVKSAAHVGGRAGSGALCFVQRDPDPVAKSERISLSTARPSTWASTAPGLHTLPYDLRFVRCILRLTRARACKTPSIHFHCLRLLLSMMPTSNTRWHHDAGPAPSSPRAGPDVRASAGALVKTRGTQRSSRAAQVLHVPAAARDQRRLSALAFSRMHAGSIQFDDGALARAGSRKEIDDGTTGSPSSPAVRRSARSALLVPVEASRGSERARP
ncbi:hypothetical protein AURDEDRAFT_175666 [Auricularia subglabra TFB-10046 SS5]|uniref:Uncharacterized protein n=1 Tax=Auricularia subglabra (strain TFB-10046 / SS5) TaxID=717982 RepID=J0D7X7_AURST|nr:hypothetical protein AURDEDRAFT_175666 [Auricularia subglabra TFB-10046 SS5]